MKKVRVNESSSKDNSQLSFIAYHALAYHWEYKCDGRF